MATLQITRYSARSDNAVFVVTLIFFFLLCDKTLVSTDNQLSLSCIVKPPKIFCKCNHLYLCFLAILNFIIFLLFVLNQYLNLNVHFVVLRIDSEFSIYYRLNVQKLMMIISGLNFCNPVIRFIAVPSRYCLQQIKYPNGVWCQVTK